MKTLLKSGANLCPHFPGALLVFLSKQMERTWASVRSRDRGIETNFRRDHTFTNCVRQPREETRAQGDSRGLALPFIALPWLTQQCVLASSSKIQRPVQMKGNGNGKLPREQQNTQFNFLPCYFTKAKSETENP